MEQAKAYKYKLSRLIKAVAGFRKVVEIDVSKFNLLIKDAIKNARIQKFEYCTELLWKTIKTFLYLNDKVDVKTPAQTMKAFLNAGYIDEKNFEILIKMLEDRNKLSHMYSEKVFDEVNKSIKKYLNTLLAVTLVLKEKK